MPPSQLRFEAEESFRETSIGFIFRLPPARLNSPHWQERKYCRQILPPSTIEEYKN